MKKRTTIRIISFLAAATVALGAASVIFYRRAVTAEAGRSATAGNTPFPSCAPRQTAFPRRSKNHSTP